MIQKNIQKGHKKSNRRAKKPTERHKNDTGRQKRLQDDVFPKIPTKNHGWLSFESNIELKGGLCFCNLIA